MYGGGGFGGESGYHIQNLNEFDCLEYSNEGGVRVKKNMLLGGRSEGHLLLDYTFRVCFPITGVH